MQAQPRVLAAGPGTLLALSQAKVGIPCWHRACTALTGSTHHANPMHADTTSKLLCHATGGGTQGPNTLPQCQLVFRYPQCSIAAQEIRPLLPTLYLNWWPYYAPHPQSTAQGCSKLATCSRRLHTVHRRDAPLPAMQHTHYAHATLPVLAPMGTHATGMCNLEQPQGAIMHCVLGWQHF